MRLHRLVFYCRSNWRNPVYEISKQLLKTIFSCSIKNLNIYCPTRGQFKAAKHLFCKYFLTSY